MATIDLAQEAPHDVSRVGLANETITDFPYETTDNVVIANAEAHPWLEVEYPDPVEASDPDFDPYPTLAPEDDVLSHVGSKANDPEAVKEELDRRKEESGDAPTLAVDAGLEQDKILTTRSGAARTLAAADDFDEEDKD